MLQARSCRKEIEDWKDPDILEAKKKPWNKSTQVLYSMFGRNYSDRLLSSTICWDEGYLRKQDNSCSYLCTMVTREIPFDKLATAGVWNIETSINRTAISIADTGL